MYCCKCGQQMPVSGSFCPICGAPQNPVIANQRSRLVAGILGILIGSLGIHRFYLGYIGIGIVQIVVTILTLGIGGLWGIVEGILILVGNFNQDAQGQPLKD